MEPRHEIDSRNAEKAPDFKSEVDAIISRPLDPETVDTYALDALDDLIGVIGRVTEAYKPQTARLSESDMNTENAAFNHFGLGDIEMILDNVASKAEELKEIDKRIAGLPLAEKVITPVGHKSGPSVKEYDGSFVEKRVVPKLKSLLFVLKNEFEMDISDKEQVIIQPGKVEKGRMRKHCFYSVELPKLDRSVLVCDEAGNATFVFNNEVLRQKGVANGNLVKLEVDDLDIFIKDYPDFGKRVIYSDNYVGNLVSAIKDPSTSKKGDEKVGEAVGEYLRPKYPKAPEGYYSVNKLSDIWPVGYESIDKAIEDYHADLEDLGEIKMYKFGVKDAYGYSPDQQALIRAVLEFNGSFNPPPEFYRSASDLAHDSDWKVHPRSVIKSAAEYKEDLEEMEKIEERMFYANSAPAYSPDHQALLYADLESKGYFREATAEIWSIPTTARQWGVDPQTVRKAIKEHEDEVGEVLPYKFPNKKDPEHLPGKLALGCTPEQRAAIKPYVDDKKKKSKS